MGTWLYGFLCHRRSWTGAQLCATHGTGLCFGATTMNYRITLATMILLLSGVASAASALPEGATPSVAPARADAIYCVVQDGTRKQVFYSGVFNGHYADSQGYQQSFLAFVEARYGEVSAGSDSLCFYEDTPQEAMDAGNGKAASDRRNGYAVTWTRWTA